MSKKHRNVLVGLIIILVIVLGWVIFAPDSDLREVNKVFESF